MNPFKSADFKRLKERWDRKLKDAGFDDIEDESGQLKNWDSLRFQKKTVYSVTWRNGFQERSEYFTLATHFLESFDFQTILQKRIWKFHAHGFSLREIGRMVGKDKDHVHAVVRDLKNKMLKRK